MSSNNNTSSSGIGFVGLLTIVFITLKLCGVIAWPWLWVLSPILISIALVSLFFLLLGLGGLVVFFWPGGNRK